MKHLLCASLALLPGACVSSQPHTGQTLSSTSMVSVFAVAHEDDWQLFMNPGVYRAMDTPQEKAVIIQVTAGDAGRGATGEPVPYYRAREEGALRAVRFMANAATPGAGLGAGMELSIVQRGGHAVERVAYANAVIYFLRLPDGYIVEGKTYTPHPASLERLRTGAAPATEAVDGSLRFDGWSDLVTTLAAIIDGERMGGAGLSLHLAETDDRLNPKDHPDHRATALAMEEVATRFPCAATFRHDEYATGTRPQNVTGEDYMIDVGTWAATASGLSDSHAAATWESEHNAWIGREYFRATPATGECAAAPTG